ncbi:MAG: hypothetical protein ACJ74G_23570 [Blastocatellia bacterium]
MGRFSRSVERGMAYREPGWPKARTSNPRAPSESKYFVLALAALVGLGVGWLSGKAITGLLPDSNSTAAITEPAVRAVSAAPRASLPASQAATGEEAAPDDASDATVSSDADAPAATVAQVTNDEPRSGRRISRHGYRRHVRAQFLLKPFKVFRKLKIW